MFSDKTKKVYDVEVEGEKFFFRRLSFNEYKNAEKIEDFNERGAHLIFKSACNEDGSKVMYEKSDGTQRPLTVADVQALDMPIFIELSQFVASINTPKKKAN